jgi:hypothetical protein
LWIRFHVHPWRVRAVLDAVRPHVDEIVAAADARVEPGELRVVADKADRLVRLPFLHPVERVNAFMHEQCHGDWVLRLDGDEIPDLELLARLRDLVTEPVTHHHLARRWLWPDPGHHLAVRPWWPDHQTRLLRNDPALVHVPGEMHTSAQVAGPARFHSFGLHHTDLLATTVEQRRRKAQIYEQIKPGLVVEKLAINEAYYLPEQRPEPPSVRPLDERERHHVTAILDAAPRVRVRRLRRVPEVVSTAAIDAVWAARELADEDYRAHIERVDTEPTFTAGEGRLLLVAIRNLGGRRWPYGDFGPPHIVVSYRWTDAEGVVLVPDGLRTPMPGPVAPGQQIVVPVSLVPPSAGRRHLEIDLVHEGVRWFGCPARVELDVAAPQVAERAP